MKIYPNVVVSGLSPVWVATLSLPTNGIVNSSKSLASPKMPAPIDVTFLEITNDFNIVAPYNASVLRVVTESGNWLISVLPF